MRSLTHTTRVKFKSVVVLLRIKYHSVLKYNNRSVRKLLFNRYLHHGIAWYV